MSRLILSRKPEEEVVVHRDGDILMRVKYLATPGISKAIRLAFEADKSIQIDRLEIYTSKYKS